MGHIHAREHLDADSAVRVNCDHQCNVMLMDDANYARYQRGDQCRYHGGFFRVLPALLRVPQGGYWNVVLDLGGREARIRYDIRYIG